MTIDEALRGSYRQFHALCVRGTYQSSEVVGNESFVSRTELAGIARYSFLIKKFRVSPSALLRADIRREASVATTRDDCSRRGSARTDITVIDSKMKRGGRAARPTNAGGNTC